MKQHDFEKYLRKNPAPVTAGGGARCFAVVPAYDEEAELPGTLKSVYAAAENAGERVAVICVVNEPAGTDNGSSLRTIRMIEKSFPQVQIIYLPGFTGGVGGARKAGMDSAVQTAGNVDELCRTVICSIDADTEISPEYFRKVIPFVRGNGGAATIGFRHRAGSDAVSQRAITEYERYLFRYVDKLKEASSPYAFFTIGSAFAVRGDAYVASGGMRVRQAGEDFYFLQAAAKRSKVVPLDEILVYPSPRVSSRVPFGTGPSVAELTAGGVLDELSDEAFEELGRLLTCAADENLKNPAAFRQNVSGRAEEFLLKENFFNVWEKILKNLPDDAGRRRKAFDDWFDGLKTLRFLHFADGRRRK